jgi:hypothetical protein
MAFEEVLDNAVDAVDLGCASEDLLAARVASFGDGA